MGLSIIPSLVAASAAAARDRAVLDAFDTVGADAPARAVPLGALPPLDPDVLALLLESGAVREGAPGDVLPVRVGARRTRRLVAALAGRVGRGPHGARRARCRAAAPPREGRPVTRRSVAERAELKRSPARVGARLVRRAVPDARRAALPEPSTSPRDEVRCPIGVPGLGDSGRSGQGSGNGGTLSSGERPPLPTSGRVLRR
jgi:hypothetical protein